ncbi:TPA: hypothetical protein JN352_003201 [Shigella flexneri]|nr:hypothetical protein [Shigella flexneri]EGE1371140.1 hypothetical protein [Shigella boydii]EGO8402131.1 hypothetical protein [Shigella flexneri]HAY5277449.1 hypothetical protein [Shigella flexneri]HAY7095952.1 hypothetical protein [Shigella flexneri]
MAENVAHISRFRKKKENAYNVSNNQVTGSGNDGGDGMNDDLERRVSCLESDVTEIKNNLITLTTRSESFATKSDVLEIREGLRLEMADLRQSLKVEMAEHRTELQKSFANQTWLLTGIVLSAMAVLVAVVTVIK